MRNLRYLAGILALGFVSQSGAVVLNVEGTFDQYNAIGVGVPLNGVTTDLSSWPPYDADQLTPGVQGLSFTVSGTVEVVGGVVVSAVINQTSTLQNDYSGATGSTRGEFNGISWTYSGGPGMGFTPGSGAGVTGTCTDIIGTGAGGCASALAALQAESDQSVWDWQGIAPNFVVSDIFGGSNLFNVDIGGPTGHPATTWTVGGETIGSVIALAVTQDLPGQGGTNPAFNSAYQGVFTLTVVPVPAAVWLFGSALGLLGWVRRRAAA